MILPIKKKWFDMIKSGVKKEEYRDIKPYYDSRFRKRIKCPTIGIEFRNGYSSNSPKIKCCCRLKFGKGKEEWGAEKNKEYYVLEIIEIWEVKIDE